jgi:hypothetical protein
MTTPEAKPDDIFGQYLFPRNRQELKVSEPDTEPEWKLRDALKNYYENNSKLQVQAMVPDVLKQIEAGNYQALLAPPDAVVYRGLNVQKSMLDKILVKYGYKTIDQYRKLGKAKTYMAIDIPGKLRPTTSLIQGWTLSMGVAMNFSTTGDRGPNRTPVIFVARTNAEGNQFFGNPVLTKTISPAVANEQEVLSYGNVEIDGFLLPRTYTYEPSFASFSSMDTDELVKLAQQL